MTALQELLSISTPPLGPKTHADSIKDDDLKSLLATHNGFFSLENALWVFSDESLVNIPGHNHPEIQNWSRKYPKTGGVSHAFAVDAIGYPFFTSNQGILRMDLETGKFVRVAMDLEGWAARILKEYSRLTAWRLCHDWQDVHGPLPDGHRLFPKMPFVGGGEETVENMAAAPLVELISFYQELAQQIRDMPEGGEIEIRMVD
ncbi:hypothetical protein [Hirschia litorea]|uniref:T6SS immunity protein Tdi1 C-terminal domain-containing protein n=1 Tax=Hirschia litorea TaxID=1199156 RepID=A0ABW2ILH9_9PROT